MGLFCGQWDPVFHLWLCGYFPWLCNSKLCWLTSSRSFSVRIHLHGSLRKNDKLVTGRTHAGFSAGPHRTRPKQLSTPENLRDCCSSHLPTILVSHSSTFAPHAAICNSWCHCQTPASLFWRRLVFCPTGYWLAYELVAFGSSAHSWKQRHNGQNTINTVRYPVRYGATQMLFWRGYRQAFPKVSVESRPCGWCGATHLPPLLASV